MKAQARRQVGRGRLHVALTSAGGRLADPTNLPFDDAHLDDDAMKAALDDLLTRKPHLGNRKAGPATTQADRQTNRLRRGF